MTIISELPTATCDPLAIHLRPTFAPPAASPQIELGLHRMRINYADEAISRVLCVCVCVCTALFGTTWHIPFNIVTWLKRLESCPLPPFSNCKNIAKFTQNFSAHLQNSQINCQHPHTHIHTRIHTHTQWNTLYILGIQKWPKHKPHTISIVNRQIIQQMLRCGYHISK